MPESKYIVVQGGYEGEHIVFGPRSGTEGKAACEKVAAEHAARRVIERKEK
jgi:hypothetical protein